jgi:hypothetical protein
MIYQLNYGIEYLGKVMCYQQKISTQIARVPRTYGYVAENKEVPDSNIGVLPVRNYANYRTLKLLKGFINKLYTSMKSYSIK